MFILQIKTNAFGDEETEPRKKRDFLEKQR